MATQEVTALPYALKEWRKARQMSQATLATKASVSAGLIAQIETNRRQPGLSTLLRIAKVLGVDPRALAIVHTDFSSLSESSEAEQVVA